MIAARDQTTMRRMLLRLVCLSLLSVTFPPHSLAQNEDPCPGGLNVSNVESRECYTKAQLAMSKRADDLAERAAVEFSEFTPEKRAEYGPVILAVSRLAAKKIKDSQIAWHTFRDQYCNAIALSYTSGSGADTAREQCLYMTASDRVRQLRTDFPGSTEPKGRARSQ